MFRRKVGSVFAASVIVGSLMVFPGCDWLQSSDPGQRSSPYISKLTVSKSSMACAVEFTVSFQYDDPQGDISSARVTRKHSGGAVVLEDSPSWPTDISRSSGTVSFPFSFSCTSPGGNWSISVQVDDERGHPSNILTREITLNAAG